MSDPSKSAGKRGLVLSRRAREYDMTPQQNKFREIAERCGIKRGISKGELQRAMSECVPREWEKERKRVGARGR